MGITVDFAARMVHGFEFPVPIIDVNEMTIIMAGASQTIHGIKIFGIIDRVTGEINVMRHLQLETRVLSTNVSLKCKPTQRMF
jgi:hypothetical protein